MAATNLSLRTGGTCLGIFAIHHSPLSGLMTPVLAAVSIHGCSATPATVSNNHDSSKASALRTAHSKDSAAVASAAVAALRGASTCCSWGLEVSKFQPSDSGYLVELQPMQSRDSTVRMIGGGGIVFVNRRGQAHIVGLFR